MQLCRSVGILSTHHGEKSRIRNFNYRENLRSIQNTVWEIFRISNPGLSRYVRDCYLEMEVRSRWSALRKKAETGSRIGIECKYHEDLAAGGRLSVEQKQALGVCYWQVSLIYGAKIRLQFLDPPNQPLSQHTTNFQAYNKCGLLASPSGYWRLTPTRRSDQC
jgi:hypothetical protein